MKRTLSILVAVVFVLGILTTGISANRGLTYTCEWGTPTIDGVEDEAWSVAQWTNVDLPHADGLTNVCSLRVKILHDDQYLYYLAEATDATIVANPDPSVGQCDAIEFYVDEDNCKDVAFCDCTTQLQIVLPEGTPVRHSGSSSMSEADAVVAYGATQNENGYLVEWAFAPINGIPADGSVMGIEFMYNDSGEDGAFLGALRWNVDTINGDTPPYLAMDNFGDMTLAAKPVVEEAPVEDVVVDDAPAAEAPVTADAGIVVAAVVMAAAAAVVLSKKH